MQYVMLRETGAAAGEIVPYFTVLLPDGTPAFRIIGEKNPFTGKLALGRLQRPGARPRAACGNPSAFLPHGVAGRAQAGCDHPESCRAPEAIPLLRRAVEDARRLFFRQL